jgi:hypothetical protein
MSNSYNERSQWCSAVQTLEAATDLELPFTFLNDVVIHKIGLRVTNTAAGGASVLFEDRTGASTDVPIETVVIPAADNDGNTLYTEILAGYVLQAGHILNIAVTETGTAPTAHVLVEYSHLDVALANRPLMVESA